MPKVYNTLKIVRNILNIPKMFVVLDDTDGCDPSVNFMSFILCINNY